MQFPESWLREFCDPPVDSAALGELLTMAGLEVEQMRSVAPPFRGVVVAEVTEVAPHPSADRLTVCRVDAGAHSKQGPLQIVCGAPNARVGLRTALALVGAELPPGEDGKPFTIKVGRLRGVESFGMLCSARELKLSDDHGGLMELAANAPPGADLRQVLQLDDTLFTLKLTTNLAHCLSVYGIAREVAALTGAPLKTPQFPPVLLRHESRLPVSIEAPDLCGRFSGRIVRNVNTKAQTPRWMVDRLARCGQRAVNALVDISNYVMFEYGRPSHIFDFDKIHQKLVVRWGKPGETLALLNGSTVTLDDKVGVIADGQGVESLAGIMGGAATAVSDTTRHVYVEAAFWWPRSIAGRSRRFGFATDAGHRFERGVDPATTVEHIERITQLIVDICGGEAGPIDDQSVNLPRPTPVVLRVERAGKVLGMPVTEAQCTDVLRRLGMTFASQPGRLIVTPPSWRFDIQIEEDLIEEVARVRGFHLLPDTPPIAPVRARPQPEARRRAHALHHALAELDYQETINFSFVDETWERDMAGNADPIRVRNPIAAHLAVMRSSLIASLVAVLKYNLDRRTTRIRVFEVGRVFCRAPDVGATDTTVTGIAQPIRLAGLAYGPVNEVQWGTTERRVDFFDVKGDVEMLLAPRAAVFSGTSHPALHPGRSASISVQGRAVGVIGELHPRWCQANELAHAPVVFELDFDPLLERPVPRFASVARQQSVWRDLAVVVPDSVSHDALLGMINDDPTGTIRGATLFDVYRAGRENKEIGAGSRSMAMRIEMLDERAPLTDERVDATMQGALERVQQLGGRLRA